MLYFINFQEKLLEFYFYKSYSYIFKLYIYKYYFLGSTLFESRFHLFKHYFFKFHIFKPHYVNFFHFDYFVISASGLYLRKIYIILAISIVRRILKQAS